MTRYHHYKLCSRGSLNAVSQRREFHGALIKVDGGVGCLHPWPEFGDAPVEEQLRLLREGATSKVIERALHMAAVDGEARRRGVSLFAGLDVPPSHYSFDGNQSADSQMERVIAEGWKAIKMKGSRDFEMTAAELKRLAGMTPAGSVRFRVDFNSCLDVPRFTEFVRSLPPDIRARFDFIEDPFPYDAALWSVTQRELGVRLACDKGVSKTDATSSAECGFEFAVLKPGRRDWRAGIGAIPNEVRIVMTSAMDHAIGQSFAAYEAALAWREIGPRMDLCGLCTEHLFEKDEFFARISSRGGMLNVDRSGTGLGFNDVLAKLPWKSL